MSITSTGQAAGQAARQRFFATGVGRWYLGREPSEQRVVLAVAVTAAAVLLWLALIAPIIDWRSQAHDRYQAAQAELEWLKANESRARSIAASGGATAQGDRSLLPVITRSAEAQSIQINRLQPESNGIVSISVQAQPFNALLSWLHQLQENNGVTVLRLAIDAEGRPGIVNAQIRLQ